MYFSTDPGERRKFIASLLELAVFLEANPQVPVPQGDTDVPLITNGATEAEEFEAVDRIAALLGVTPERRGHYTATRHFGQLRYRVFAIPADWEAEYQARRSYDRNITFTAASEPAPAA